MLNQSSNSNTNLAAPLEVNVQSLQPKALSEKQSFIFLINSDHCYLQLRVSTKKASVFIGGLGLMLIGKLNPELFDVLWALLF